MRLRDVCPKGAPPLLRGRRGIRPALLLVFVAAAPAFAQNLDLYGFGPRAIAMGGVEEAARDDAAASFYNPALLGRGSFSLGLAYAKPSMQFNQSVVPDQTDPLQVRLPVDYS